MHIIEHCVSLNPECLYPAPFSAQLYFIVHSIITYVIYC